MFNRYARGLPAILADLVEHFDRLVNFFWPDILEKYFNKPADLPVHLYFVYPLTAKDAVSNFLRLFECCVADFRDANYQDWKQVQRFLSKLDPAASKGSSSAFMLA